jgi:putative N6-adenine-specific DNA methylase
MILIAKTFSGVEDILCAELEAIGAYNLRKLTRAVEFEGDQEVMYKANLLCRTALRVLKPYKTFEASDEEMLYKEIQNIDWSEHFTLQQTFAINTTLNLSNLTHSQYVSQKAKDAIVDQFRGATGDRPSVDIENADFRIHLHIYDNNCTLSFDSSGESLHKRGYRDQTNLAPLNEAMAAALVLLSDWDPTTTLADFMCGSGTILIEAALIARNIAPNKLKKRFGFQSWKDYDETLWKQIYDEAIARELPSVEPKIFGSDIDGEVLEKAWQNIENAGLENDIRLKEIPFQTFTPPTPEGTLISNPPYGMRLEPDDIMEMYKTIGDTMKQQLKGWTCWIFTGNLEVAKYIGLRPTRKIHLFNGPIECRFLKFEIYSGTKKIHKLNKADESSDI